MNYRRFDDADKFYAHVLPFLIQQEAEHNLLLGIIRGIQLGYYDEFYLACVEDAGQVVAVVMRTPPHNVLLSQIQNPHAIIPLMVEDLRTVYPALSGVHGDKVAARIFAELWDAATGQPFQLNMKQRIYKLEQVIFPQGIQGEFRWATQADFPLLVNWYQGFYVDSGLGTIATDQAHKVIQRYLDEDPKERRFGLWRVDGVTVSMSAYMGATPNGMRVGAVYTPQEHRKNGYASACVAYLSQAILDIGKQFCFLFTDLGNPTSNRIYQDIGYRPICDADEYKFEESIL